VSDAQQQGLQAPVLYFMMLMPRFDTRVSVAAGLDLTCFAGDTVLQVRNDTSGRAVPVKIRNVKTGQHILCTDTNEDLRLPTKASWCEVINWVSRSPWQLVVAQPERKENSGVTFVTARPGVRPLKEPPISSSSHFNVTCCL
jgi:hypothetical protein